MDHPTQHVPPPEGDERDEGALLPAPWGLADAVGAFVLSFLLGAVAYAVLELALEPELARAAFFPVSLALLGGSAVLMLAVRHREHLGALLGRRPRPADVGAGLAHGTVAFLVINVGYAAALQFLTSLTGAEMPVVQEGLREATLDGRYGFLVIASAVLVAPIAEELFFRGVLFRGLLGPLGAWPAIGTSALLFGFAHYESGNLQGSLYALLVLASLGMYLAWAFNRRGSLVVPIVMHATFNALAVGGIFVAGSTG